MDKIKLFAPLLGRMGWLGSSEMVIRLTRIVTVVSMAYYLSPAQFAVAATALVCFEMTRVVGQSGIGAKLIAVADEDLPRFNTAGFRLNFAVNLALALCVVGLAKPLEVLFGLSELAKLLWCFVPVFLLLPTVTIKVINTQRAQDMRRVALFTGAMVSVENLTIPVALLCGAGVYSVAIAKLIAVMVWVICWTRQDRVVPYARCSAEDVRHLISFAGTVMVTESVKALRGHADVLLAGVVLNPTQLGFYTFAKNAGVGLSLSLVNAAGTVIYPWMSRAKENAPSRVLVLVPVALTGLLVLLFALQAVASLWYVPWLFDDTWHDADLYVAIACLSAVPRSVVDVRGLYLRALDSPASEFALHARNTLIFLACLMFLIFTLDASSAFLFSVCLTLSHMLALSGWFEFPHVIGVNYGR